MVVVFFRKNKPTFPKVEGEGEAARDFEGDGDLNKDRRKMREREEDGER